MKTLTKAFIATSLCLITAVPAYAGHGHGQKNERLIDRIERQQQRIEHGIENHELTRREAKVLRKEQRQIRRLFREFREDKRLSKKERRILNKKLDRASNRIWEFKHNEYARNRGHSDRYGYEWDGGRRSNHRYTYTW